MFPLPLEISGFRSLLEPVRLPFTKKISIIAGPNNSGKSNVLRLLAILFNKDGTAINEALDFESTSNRATATVKIDASYADTVLQAYPYARDAFRKFGDGFLTGEFQIAKSGISFSIREKSGSGHITDYINNSYEVGSDFGSTGQRNMGHLERILSPDKYLLGTTYVPNIRFVTHANQEVPSFVSTPFPGLTIAFGKVIEQLAEMDRPSVDVSNKRLQLSQICEFMAYCLDKQRVSIQVPADRSTIRIGIDGDERPLGSLGTGVEQLLMIGLAAIGFPGKLVLIDEPELHLHPTSQRRIVRYLDENVDAQFVISTHSAAIMDTVESDIIQIGHVDGQGTISRTITSRGDRSRAVRDLGHSPSELVQTRFAIWVEGPSDRIYLCHWINRVDPSITEGVDYSILFYGGAILSHHGFTDDDVDLVKALSLSRAFAVIIDSDRTVSKPRLRDTKVRVKGEVEKHGGFCWITDGREVENYLSLSIVAQLAREFPYVQEVSDKRDQILDPQRASKTKIARRAIEISDDSWHLDLKQKVTQLVKLIHEAR